MTTDQLQWAATTFVAIIGALLGVLYRGAKKEIETARKRGHENASEVASVKMDIAAHKEQLEAHSERIAQHVRDDERAFDRLIVVLDRLEQKVDRVLLRTPMPPSGR